MKHKWIYVSKNTHRLETNIIKKSSISKLMLVQHLNWLNISFEIFGFIISLLIL